MATQLDALPQTSPVDIDPSSPVAQGRRARRHVRLFYVIRTITVLGALGMSSLYLAQTGPIHRYHIFIFFVALVYPHLSYLLQAKLEAGRRIEHATLLLDAFVGGSLIHFMEFSLLPSVVIMMIALVNPVAYTGFSMMGGSALALIGGIALPGSNYGLTFALEGLPAVNMTAAVFLFVYYCMFAYAVFARTNALQKSRRELQQQKVIAEIERKRSDMLLLGILPGAAAQEFEATTTVRPRRYERAVLLAVAFPALSRSAHMRDAAEFLAEINQLFKSLDAICARHGLESIKTAADRYKAAAGLGERNDAAVPAALRAALEMQRFIGEHSASRLARALPPLDCQIAVHAGPVVAGVIETRKFSYDLFGQAVIDLDRMLALAPHGEVMVSAGICEQAGGEFPYRRLGDIPVEDGRSIPVGALGAPRE